MIKRVKLSPERFVQLEDEIKRLDLINELIEKGYHEDPDILQWLKEVLKKEAEKEKPEREIIFRLVNIVAEDIDGKEIRNLLGKIFEKGEKESANYDAVKNILISALIDELPEVKDWAVELLKSKAEIKEGDSAEIEKYIIENLRDNKNPCVIRENAAMALGDIGSKNAVKAMISTEKELCDAEAPENLYGEIVNKSLLKNIAYSLGLAAEKMDRESAIEAIGKLLLLESSRDDEEIKKMVQWSRREIYKHYPDIFFIVLILANTVKRLLARQPVRRGLKSGTEDLFTTVILEDDDKKYKFELIVNNADQTVRRITLLRSPELKDVETLSLTLFTDIPEKPEVKCLLHKTEGYEGLSANIHREEIKKENIQAIKVEKQDETPIHQ